MTPTSVALAFIVAVTLTPNAACHASCATCTTTTACATCPPGQLSIPSTGLCTDNACESSICALLALHSWARRGLIVCGSHFAGKDETNVCRPDPPISCASPPILPVGTCPDGTKSNGTACNPCTVANCEVCAPGSALTCAKCATGYGTSDDATCVACHASCATCTTATACATCPPRQLFIPSTGLCTGNGTCECSDSQPLARLGDLGDGHGIDPVMGASACLALHLARAHRLPE